MKTIFCVLVFAVIAPWVRAQTNLTDLLQQGMFEEQANHNLDAAISNYQALSTQFDKDRQLAATAIFRLGECYREEGQTNEAAMEYRRIVNEFQDQKTLVTLSQEDLAGMGAASPVAGEMTENSAAPARTGNTSAEAALLASQISGIESLKSDPEEEARATLAIFPAEASELEEMVLQLPKLREQEAWAKDNPKATYNQMFQARGVVRAVGADNYINLAAALAEPTNMPAFSSDELKKQVSALEGKVNFLLDVQKARLKALQAAAGTQARPEAAQEAAPSDDEDQEIARIQQMIQNSPDLINAPGQNKRTPLADAAAKGQVKVAAFLLDHGADANATSRGGAPLYWAADSAQRTMVEFLLQHGADVNADGGAALEVAINRGYEAVAETILKAHADVNVKNNIGQTPLLLAAASGKTKFIQMLLDAGANPNMADYDGVTALSRATHVNYPLDLAPLKLLLAAGADPNGGKCDAPLLCAINNRNTASAKLLLDAGANPNLKSRISPNLGNVNVNGNQEDYATPLWAAVFMGDAPMVQLLLKYKADRSEMNNTPLIFSAVDKINVLEALLNAGASPNIINGDGRTPLSVAAENGSPEAVKMLLAAKADPNAGTLDAPLLCAIDKQDLASAGLLLQAGADPNVDGLMHCPQGSYGSRWYGEYSAILRKAPALWLAIQKHHLPMVQLLLKYKANPDNSQISEPPAVIFWTLSNTNILKALLDSGADPNIKNGDGETPLKIVEDVESGNGNFGSNIPIDQQQKIAASAADSLRQHGALEVLPDWDRITASRPSTKNSYAVIYRGTNSWNRFTLLELLSKVDYPNRFPFPDFARIAVLRPSATGEKSRRIRVNILNSTNGVDCSREIILEFGDIVEVPEREHTLAENDTQTGKLIAEMEWYLKKKAGTAKLIVDGGQTIEVPLSDFEPVTCYLKDLLTSPICRSVLMSDSDLSRVNVTRRDAKTGKLETWTLDRSGHGPRWLYDPSDLWVRDGDVIEVPEAKSD